MAEVLLKPREDILASLEMVPGFHAYGWKVDDQRGVYFVHPDVVCLDVEGQQLGLPRKLLTGDEKGNLSEFLLPDLSTAELAISRVASHDGVTPEIRRLDVVGEFGAYQEMIDENRFATRYPGLEGYLVMRLRELGEVEVQQSPVKSITATITFDQIPHIVNDQGGNRLDGGIWINSDAGGCVPGGASCRKLPSPNNRTCSFDFDLSLDSQWIKPELHSADFVMDQIDTFVRAAKVGFSYSFSGCYVDPSMRTKRN